MDPWECLYKRAEAQYGYLHARQAVRCGISRSTFYERVRREGWREPHPGSGVFGSPGAARSFEGRVSASLLAVGGRVLASRETAAYLHGMIDRPPRIVELVVPNGRRAPALVDACVWRSRTLLRRDAQTVRRLAATAPDRTILDLAAVYPIPRLRGFVLDVNQRRITTLDGLLECVARVPTAPRCSSLRRVLYDIAPEVCDSNLEYYTRRTLEVYDFTPDPDHALVQAGDRTLEIDIPFSAYRVGIEANGFGVHSRRVDLDRDNRRHNRIAIYTDWLILHVTWDRLETDRAGFLEEVWKALESRGALVPRPTWRTTPPRSGSLHDLFGAPTPRLVP